MTKLIADKIVLISKILHYIAVGMIALMMFLTVAAVIMRYIFRNPILGAYEITELMMVVVVFFALAYTQVRNRHVSIDILVTHLRERVRKIIESIVVLLTFIFFVIFTWRSYGQSLFVLSKGDSSIELGIPFYPFVLVIVISSGVLCLVLLIDIVRSIAASIKK